MESTVFNLQNQKAEEERRLFAGVLVGQELYQ
jgi:hypothetical protein